MFRTTLIALALFILTACGPGIRFKPGEIPAPTTTDPSYIQQGQQMHQQTVANAAILRDPAAERRVSNILSKLFDSTPTTGHWTVTLIDEPVFNAMTAPGNYIFVYRGLLDAVPSDDEVAMVLAHEIGHRLAQHELDTSEEKWGTAIAALATLAAGVAVASQEGSTEQDVKDIMQSTRQLGAGFTTFRYSKDQEREADQIGIFLLADAGIDPSGAVSLWSRQAAADISSRDDFFSTHPLSEDRQAMAAQLLPLANARYQQALSKRKQKKSKTKPAPLNSEVEQHVRLAEDAIAKSDLKTAAALAQSLTTRAPSAPVAYNVLGRVKALLGEPKQARKAFERGLKLAPEDPILVYNVGCMQALQGDKIAARTSSLDNSSGYGL